MSSVMRAEYDYADALMREFGVKRRPDITFKTRDTEVIARTQRQLAQGDPIDVNLPEWHGKAYVTMCKPIFDPDGNLECEITLRPTGAPRRLHVHLGRSPIQSVWQKYLAPIYELDRVRYRSGTDFGPRPSQTVITGLPPRANGVIAQHLYVGKSFTQSVIEQLAKSVRVPVERLTAPPRIYIGACEREIIDRIADANRKHGAFTRAIMDEVKRGGLKYTSIVDDPHAPIAGKSQQIIDWYTKLREPITPFWYRRFDDKIVTFDYESTLQSRGRILRSPESHPNCRCTLVLDSKPMTQALNDLSKRMNTYIESTLIKGTSTKKEKRMKVRNKFYVAAPSVTSQSEQNQDNVPAQVHLATAPNDHSGKWTRKDLAAAVAHAQTLLEADPSKDHVAVVKIVKIIRRPKPKFIVEDVK